jgi:hypothetical protein
VSDPAWQNTPASRYAAAGIHTGTVTGLLADTAYEFRAQLVSGDVEVLGEVRRFRAEDTLTFFTGAPTSGLAPLSVTFTAATDSPAAYR